MANKLNELRKKMPFKWKPQAKVGKRFHCVAYIDARQARDLLDEVVGPANWTSEYKEVKGNVYCGIGINVGMVCGSDKDKWVYKWDCGIESNMDSKKGEASDAFKRACVQWGVGRFLYDEEIVKVGVNESGRRPMPADAKGNVIWDLTEYVNSGKYAQEWTKYGPKTDSSSSSNSRSGRYNPEKGGANVSYSRKQNFSPEVINKVKALEKDGKKGKEVLVDFIPAYNKANKTEYKYVADFDTDEKINALIKLVEDEVPAAMQ